MTWIKSKNLNITINFKLIIINKMETERPYAKVLKILLKDIAIKPTITSIAKEMDMSRVGLWKVLKAMQSKKLIALSPVGTGKTSAYIMTLNWNNPLIEKMLSLALTEEAMKNQRWLSSFSELENQVDFLLLYGSILHSPKEANDIDVLGIVSDKRHFKKIGEIIAKIQKTQIKKVHAINFTAAEFRQELEKPNKAFIDAVKQGIVLFGQENFIKFIIAISKK